MNEIHRRAHAKVNLALSVGPPIAEGPHAGMHPIASWFAPIDLADDVLIRRSNTRSAYRIAWHDGTPIGWPIEEDLAVRAHRALEHHIERELPVDLQVTKHIPAGGGLGGGSADAGCTLTSLNDLFELGLSVDALASLGASLGSDIPFFVDHQTPPRHALVTGLGTTIERVASVSASLTLVFPPFGCPTGAVYRAFDDTPTTLDEQRVRGLIGRETLGAHESALLFNDLAEPACRIEPRLGTLRSDLVEQLGEHVHVSGSGSTLFVVGNHAERIEGSFSGVGVVTTRTLG